ncbi:hypothetical protein SAMN05428995_10690 [Loktanella sp. DSM 29012]|uniref:Uncharacterized protein n=1 Tax=Loktanella gaetbuli TaxID=2881335 RepID=A0ABS8BRS5_9RHOB|nr:MULTISPECIES: hypothetical protein [Loktanella]MCB5198284.1 hypothetical protein [Loktanella gaetbuli]SEQ69477.1 hypothetical protein SAMN05428995_10690 [Loktanella sp. DSM 29012]
MSPELTILVINAVFVGFAYGFAYPMLRVRTMNRLALFDLIIGSAALILAGLLYYGSGIRFSMILFDTNWLFFSLVTMALIEIIPATLYMRRHGISMMDDPE